VADRGDAKPNQVLGREVEQDLGIDVVRAERFFVVRGETTTGDKLFGPEVRWVESYLNRPGGTAQTLQMCS
jgi:hypothetical protein